MELFDTEMEGGGGDKEREEVDRLTYRRGGKRED